MDSEILKAITLLARQNELTSDMTSNLKLLKSSISEQLGRK